MVSLVDIKPTILSFLKLPISETDGQSLLPYIKGKKISGPARMIFTESGFSPTTVRAKTISIKDIVYQNINIFGVVPKTGRIILKPSMEKKLIVTKQRAVYYGHWFLALYPDKNHKWISVLVDRKTGRWTDDLTHPFANHSPAKKMVNALKKHYGEEIAVTNFL